MGVESFHPQYIRWATHWRKMRDVVLGQEAMERATIGSRLPRGSTHQLAPSLTRDYYLPKLGGQSEAEYNAYVKRASFYGATARTIDALVGAVFRRDPQVKSSELLDEHLENVDLAGTPLATFAKVVVSEQLTTGRYGILIDAPPEAGRPYWAGYSAENILSWRTERIGGATLLTRVVLRECHWRTPPGDEFGYEEAETYRVLDLDDTGYYRVRIYEAGEPDAVQTAEFLPTRLGERLTFIPFFFCGVLSVGADPERPPLLDLADVNLAHYRKAADYAHGLHFTALPTPWISDREFAEKAFKIGSETAWTMSEVGRCGMLEFSGAGIAAIKDALIDDETRMAHLGAELLAPDKRAVEAADALRIRAMAKTASLASIANTASWALSHAAETHSWWIGEPEVVTEETCIALNTEFVESRLEPAELTAWVAARQAGEVTRRMLLERLAKFEALGEQSIDEVLLELEQSADLKAEMAALKAEAQRFRDMATLVTDLGAAPSAAPAAPSPLAMDGVPAPELEPGEGGQATPTDQPTLRQLRGRG